MRGNSMVLKKQWKFITIQIVRHEGMAKTRKDFIADLLVDKRMTGVQQQRFLLLATGLAESGGVHLVAKKHSPILTAEKLDLFKTGNKLKWITHNFPASDVESFDYKKVTHDAIEEFNEISIDLPASLIGIISLFLKPRKKDPISKFRYLSDLYETWWSKKIKKWCMENPKLHPDTNPEISRDIIMPFKKSIEIRDGNDLIEAINYKLKKMFGPGILEELNIDYTGVKRSTRFFTGVDQLMTGVAALFSPILKRKNISNKVKISSALRDMNDRYVWQVTITHIGSHPEQEFSQSLFNHGDLGTAKSRFTSLCDWEVAANFSDGTYAVPLLNAAGLVDITRQDPVEGFTHKLIFY